MLRDASSSGTRRLCGHESGETSLELGVTMAVALTLGLTSVVWITDVASGRMTEPKRAAVHVVELAGRTNDGVVTTVDDPEDTVVHPASSLVPLLPWYLQVWNEGLWEFVPKVGSALATAVTAFPNAMVELVTALPELLPVVADEPSLLVDLGAAMVTQWASDAHTLATTSDQEVASTLIAGIILDRAPFEKLFAVARLGKLRRLGRALGHLDDAAHARFPFLAGKKTQSLAKGVACFTAGTPVHSVEGLRSIATIELGDRVATFRGSPDRTTEVDASWRRIELELHDRESADGVVSVALLRPSTWIARTRAHVGAMVLIELPEMNVRGEARVTAIGDAPSIEQGAGRVVVATMQSRRADVLVLKLQGTNETLEPTTGHKLYSVDRNDWIAAGKLRVGERLRSVNGDAVIAAIEHKPGIHTVYNLEVETEHEYLVGKLGIRSHNDCAQSAPHLSRYINPYVSNLTSADRDAWTRFVRALEAPVPSNKIGEPGYMRLEEQTSPRTWRTLGNRLFEASTERPRAANNVFVHRTSDGHIDAAMLVKQEPYELRVLSLEGRNWQSGYELLQQSALESTRRGLQGRVIAADTVGGRNFDGVAFLRVATTDDMALTPRRAQVLIRGEYDMPDVADDVEAQLMQMNEFALGRYSPSLLEELERLADARSTFDLRKVLSNEIDFDCDRTWLGSHNQLPNDDVMVLVHAAAHALEPYADAKLFRELYPNAPIDRDLVYRLGGYLRGSAYEDWYVSRRLEDEGRALLREFEVGDEIARNSGRELIWESSRYPELVAMYQSYLAHGKRWGAQAQWEMGAARAALHSGHHVLDIAQSFRIKSEAARDSLMGLRSKFPLPFRAGR